MTDNQTETLLDGRPRPRPDRNYAGETRTPSVPLTLVYGRLMTCMVCGAHVDVFEVPYGYIDPAVYVCGDCQEGVEAAG